MRKLVYLLSLVLMVVFTSCGDDGSIQPEKVEPEVPTIQLSDLAGQWYFQSLLFNGVTYTDCDEDLNVDYDWVTINLNFVGNTMNLTSECVDDNSIANITFNITYVDNIITTTNTTLPKKFEVQSLIGNTLKLKFIEDSGTDTPINGVYTLKKY